MLRTHGDINTQPGFQKAQKMVPLILFREITEDFMEKGAGLEGFAGVCWVEKQEKAFQTEVTAPGRAPWMALRSETLQKPEKRELNLVRGKLHS